MGTRVNYEIMREDEPDRPAVILFTNSSHDRVCPEDLFKLCASDAVGPTALTRELLNLTYSVQSANGRHRAREPIYSIDTSPGDRERVYRVRFAASEELVARGYVARSNQVARITVSEA